MTFTNFSEMGPGFEWRLPVSLSWEWITLGTPLWARFISFKFSPASECSNDVVMIYEVMHKHVFTLDWTKLGQPRPPSQPWVDKRPILDNNHSSTTLSIRTVQKLKYSLFCLKKYLSFNWYNLYLVKSTSSLCSLPCRFIDISLFIFWYVDK